MSQTLSRNDVIIALELAYDYHSARAYLPELLQEVELDKTLDSFDSKAMGLLIGALERELPRTERCISLLSKRSGVTAAVAPPAPAPKAAPAKKEEKPKKAAAKPKAEEAEPAPAEPAAEEEKPKKKTTKKKSSKKSKKDEAPAKEEKPKKKTTKKKKS